MEEKLKQAALRLQEVELLLAQPEVYADPARLRALTREQKELTPVVSAFGELEAARAMQSEAEQMLSDPELRELAREELRQAKERQEALLQELKLLLLPIVVGISYEFNRLVGRYDNWLTHALSAPGMWLQYLTTNEPDDSMLEVGIEALTLVLPEKEGEDRW